MKGLLLCLATISCLSVKPPISHAQPASGSFTVTGDIPNPVRLSSADLEQMAPEQVTVQEEEGGTPVHYTAVPLRAVLEKAGAGAFGHLRGKALSEYVLAKAKDGYEVVFSFGELSPTFGNERVLIAFEREGKPLFQYQGPFRIICPEDKAGARSLRMLDSLEVASLRK